MCSCATRSSVRFSTDASMLAGVRCPLLLRTRWPNEAEALSDDVHAIPPYIASAEARYCPGKITYATIDVKNREQLCALNPARLKLSSSWRRPTTVCPGKNHGRNDCREESRKRPGTLDVARLKHVVVPASAGIQAKKGRATARRGLDSGLRRSDEGGYPIFPGQQWA